MEISGANASKLNCKVVVEAANAPIMPDGDQVWTSIVNACVVPYFFVIMINAVSFFLGTCASEEKKCILRVWH